ncbi:MAG TPA: DUF4410 domain-containing protein [Candidatus Binataceae bacterium]|nr:DUF4410 domain-containing protein [Candidatus Binataceae bacterium]
MAAEPVAPVEIAVNDFIFDTGDVTENGSPLTRGIDFFRKSNPNERRVGIGDDLAKRISAQTAKRLDKMGLPAERIPADSDAPLIDNTLLITGRMTKIDEGNGFTRVTFGLGAGESELATEVHVYRIMQGEHAEVLAFTTYSNSGKMPGVAWSMGFGEFFLGPVTLIAALDDAASSGQKFYASQIDYLSGETAIQIANYISQYSANEGWIVPSKAGSVKLRTE